MFTIVCCISLSVVISSKWKQYWKDAFQSETSWLLCRMLNNLFQHLHLWCLSLLTATKTFVKISVGSLPERRSEGVILHQSPIVDENWSINVNHQPPIVEENQNWWSFHLNIIDCGEVFQMIYNWSVFPRWYIQNLNGILDISSGKSSLTSLVQTSMPYNAIMAGEHHTKPGLFFPTNMFAYLTVYPNISHWISHWIPKKQSWKIPWKVSRNPTKSQY